MAIRKKDRYLIMEHNFCLKFGRIFMFYSKKDNF